MLSVLAAGSDDNEYDREKNGMRPTSFHLFLKPLLRRAFRHGLLPIMKKNSSSLQTAEFRTFEHIRGTCNCAVGPMENTKPSGTASAAPFRKRSAKKIPSNVAAAMIVISGFILATLFGSSASSAMGDLATGVILSMMCACLAAMMMPMAAIIPRTHAGGTSSITLPSTVTIKSAAGPFDGELRFADE